MSCTAYRRPTSDFYPRPPRGGRRCLRSVSSCSTAFLSTPSARRATSVSSNPFAVASISIHALREEGDTALCELDAALNKISIHALREEGDQHLLSCTLQHVIFLSTPSARRATRARSCACRCDTISIHALREEGDADTGCTIYLDFDFYPRPPRGGRRKGSWETCCITSYFYPRPPRGGRPADPPKSAGERNFYPRPPRGGRRAMAGAWKLSRRNFYPRPPRGGRRGKTTVLCELLLISIHALREEGDPRCRKA